MPDLPLSQPMTRSIAVAVHSAQIDADCNGIHPDQVRGVITTIAYNRYLTECGAFTYPVIGLAGREALVCGVKFKIVEAQSQDDFRITCFYEANLDA